MPRANSVPMCQELKRFHVNTLVRVCDATYDKAPVEKEGIQVVVSVDTRVHHWLVPFFRSSPESGPFLLPGLALRRRGSSSHPDCGRLAQAAQHQVPRGTRLLHCRALRSRARAVSVMIPPKLPNRHFH